MMTLLSFLEVFCVKNKKMGADLRSSWKITQFKIKNKKMVESEFEWGKYRWFKISYFFKTFVIAEQLQRAFEFP